VSAVGDHVGQAGELSLQAGIGVVLELGHLGRGVEEGRVLGNPLAGVAGEVQAGEPGVTRLELINDPQGLEIVLETAVSLHEVVQGSLTGVTERRLCEPLGYLGDLHGMSETGPVEVTLVVDVNLGLVLEPSKSHGVEDAVTVVLIGCTGVRVFSAFSEKQAKGARLTLSFSYAWSLPLRYAIVLLPQGPFPVLLPL